MGAENRGLVNQNNFNQGMSDASVKSSVDSLLACKMFSVQFRCLDAVWHVTIVNP